jgi:hypothetical protein
VLPSVVMNKIDVGGSEAFQPRCRSMRDATGDGKFMVDGMDVSRPFGRRHHRQLHLDPFSYEETSSARRRFRRELHRRHQLQR